MPSLTGYPAMIQIDTNNASLSDVLVAFDDDPTQATFSSIFTNAKSPTVAFNRNQGQFIIQNAFPMTQQNARWVALEVKGANADDNLKIFDWYMAYKEQRTEQ